MRAFDRLGMDVAAFAIIAVQMNPALSGITIHEWLGVLLIVPLTIHLVLNWSWTVTAIDRFLGRIRPTMRSNLIIDTGLFLSMVAVGLSGVLLIPGFAVSLGIAVSPLWHAVHLVSANLTLAFFCAHLALHARWMLNTIRRAFETNSRAPVPARPRPASPPSRHAPEHLRTTNPATVTPPRGA